MCICIYIHMCICIYIHMYMYVKIQIYTYIYVYVYMYTYLTHTDSAKRSTHPRRHASTRVRTRVQLQTSGRHGQLSVELGQRTGVKFVHILDSINFDRVYFCPFIKINLDLGRVWIRTRPGSKTVYIYSRVPCQKF